MGADAKSSDQIEPATPAISDPTCLPFAFPSVRGKKLTAAFDGGRLPETGADLMSQPTVSRMENTPGLRDLIRLGRVLVDVFCASYVVPPAVITLDIDDTCDVVHGQQQLSLFNAHHDERCLPRLSKSMTPPPAVPSR